MPVLKPQKMMSSSQQTLVTFSLQSPPTLNVLISGSKSDQSFLKDQDEDICVLINIVPDDVWFILSAAPNSHVNEISPLLGYGPTPL